MRIARSCRPLARAVRMYSRASSSMPDDRMYWLKPATLLMDSTMTGSTIAFRSEKSPPTEEMPPGKLGWNQWKCTLKMAMSSSASMKSGAEYRVNQVLATTSSRMVP